MRGAVGLAPPVGEERLQWMSDIAWFSLFYVVTLGYRVSMLPVVLCEWGPVLRPFDHDVFMAWRYVVAAWSVIAGPGGVHVSPGGSVCGGAGKWIA